jgi:hypothetical protein
MIDAEESSGYIEALMDSEYVGLYLRILKAFEVYHASEDPDTEKLKQFQQAIDSILANPHCDESLKLIADSFSLTVEGYRLNDQILNYLLIHRELGRKLFVGSEKHKLRSEQIDNYNKRFNELKAKALGDKNQFTYHNICLNGIKIQYIQAFYTDIILNIDRKTLTAKSDLVASEKKILNEQADYVGSIAKVCEQMSAWENMVAAMSQQYELLHFIGDFKQADLVLKKMEKIILDNDWYGLEEKLTHLKNKGTGHEIFAEMVIKSLSQTDERNKELISLRDEINQMDMEDKQRSLSITEKTCQLQIIPFGFFCFEKSVLDDVFEVIRVTEKAKQGIFNVMKMHVIPIVNIYNDPVISEGPANGEFDNKGLVSLKHIHKIRKELRAIGVYKVFPKFGS